MGPFLQRIRQRRLVQWIVAYLGGAWLLLQVLDLVGETFDWPDVVGRGAIVLLGVGFLAALVLAWYHGERGEQRVTGMELVMLTGILALAGVGVASVGGGTLERERTTRGQADASSRTALTPDRKTVAVLPFDNLSAEAENAFFASGLHDEVLTQLSKIGGLKVISRTSVNRYRATQKSLKEIAAELGAGVVVEGSVQRAGERVRVQAQLIDARTDQHLWAEKYDSDLTDLFAIQSDVAREIAAALQAELTPGERERIERIPTKSAEAYDFYLRANDYRLRLGNREEDLRHAEQLYERAIALDPDFALAYAWLSFVHTEFFWFAHDRTPARVERQKAAAAAALRLQPDLAEAHLAMGYYWLVQRDYMQALEELEVARRSLPSNAAILSALGFVHRRLGNWDEAIAHQQKAAELDPRDPDIHDDLGTTLEIVRRYPEAARAWDRAIALAPDYYAPVSNRGWLFARWEGTLDTLHAGLARFSSASEAISDSATPAFDRWQLAFWSRDAAEALRLAGAMPPTYHSRALRVAWAHRLADDSSAARAAFGSARTALEAERRKRPDDAGIRIALGFAYAGLGQKSAAAAEANTALELLPESRDALDGPANTAAAAAVLAQAGDADAALRLLEDLLGRPSFLSPHMLRLDPLWDPIRSHPRFQKLSAGGG